MARDRSAATPLLASSLAMVLALVSNLSWGEEPAPVNKPAPEKPATQSAPKPPRTNAELPGVVIGAHERCVDIEFLDTLLFAGSLIRSNGPGPRQYLSDLSGNVILIATVGGELLCLPGVHSNENAPLMWQVDPTELPEVGSRVTLRLRPHV